MAAAQYLRRALFTAPALVARGARNGGWHEAYRVADGVMASASSPHGEMVKAAKRRRHRSAGAANGDSAAITAATIGDGGENQALGVWARHQSAALAGVWRIGGGNLSWRRVKIGARRLGNGGGANPASGEIWLAQAQASANQSAAAAQRRRRQYQAKNNKSAATKAAWLAASAAAAAAALKKAKLSRRQTAASRMLRIVYGGGENNKHAGEKSVNALWLFSVVYGSRQLSVSARSNARSAARRHQYQRKRHRRGVNHRSAYSNGIASAAKYGGAA